MQAFDRDATRASIRDQCEYAEISPESMDAIFADYSMHFEEIPCRTFYDLGSGTGKNVFLAALSGIFERTVGIEILPELSAIAEVLHESFKEDVCTDSGVAVELRTASFLEDLEWVTDAGVVYCNTIMFEEALMAALAAHASSMQPGAIFITLGQSLPACTNETQSSNAFEIIGTLHTRHSFGGGVDTFIHRRGA